MTKARAAARSRTPELISSGAILAMTGLALLLLPSLAQGEVQLEPSRRAKVVPADLPPDEAALARLYLQVLPTVVAVYGESDMASAEGVETTRTHGAGVVISPGGQMLTAAHVIEGEERILVRMQDGIERPAALLLVDKSTDLALLELTEPVTNLPSAALGDSDQLAIGQRVIVIGSPFGLINSLSVGRISGFRESRFEGDEAAGHAAEFIQTDAAINLGNSGGPLFDSAGRLVAIASSYWTAKGSPGGIGFAVTINTAIEHFLTSSHLAHADGSGPERGLRDSRPDPGQSRASYARESDSN